MATPEEARLTQSCGGYDFEKDSNLRLCLAASRELFKMLDFLNQADDEFCLGIGFSLFKLR
ncbi:hypothetical protein M434DRAFT_393663 [Hypoxylon sp. CO27-5]|nr:hypothetical protein M434DRAFT_393663 [Hypoxylon sp. CO27-5]